MSNQYKTECPRCHTVYPMPTAKLSDQKARANCGKCGHTFFLNMHLIAPTQENPNQQPTQKGQLQQANKQAPSTPAQTQQNPANTPSHNKKRQKPAITEGMIFDGMETEQEENGEISFSDDELNNFLNRDIAAEANVAATAKDSGQHQNDETWLDDLLKQEQSPSIEVLSRQNDTDAISKIIGQDLESLIPQAQREEDPKLVMKKIQSRLNAHQSTQEQLMTKRGIGSTLCWGLICLLMLGLAAGQYLFFNSTAIAKDPAQSALVKQFCSFCQLPSADTTALQISYYLQDGQADFSTDLIGTIKNTYDTDQLYPNIKISVMGGRGLLGELVLSPKEYLAFEQLTLSANKDDRFMLTLDIPRDEISSVTIEPFY